MSRKRATLRRALLAAVPLFTLDQRTIWAEVNVRVHIDVAKKYQIIEGFGATTLSLVDRGAKGDDDLDNMQALRERAIETLYGEVRITMGNLQIPILEALNDDDDPGHLNWAGFDVRESRFMKEKIVDPGKRYGFDNFQLAYTINFRRMARLKQIRERDYQRYLDECSEHITAGAIYWRDTWKIEPRLVMPFNEPLSGNRELEGGSTQEVVDIVKRAGARLRQAGFTSTKFLVPNEESEAKSLETANAILSDHDAAQYVGAIGYHPYPYGSPYASVRRILDTSGKGAPDASGVELRRNLRELSHRYILPVWMTEVSHGEVPFDSMDAVRGRAIHIHDEFKYAEATAYFGMNAIWDTTTHREHTHGSRPFESEGDTLVLADNETGKVTITGMGYAIGHYARWVRRGDVRVEATSRDPLVQVSAFANADGSRLSFVLINNAPEERRVVVSLDGAIFKNAMAGEQSTGQVRWQPIVPFASQAAALMLRLPPESVTSVGAQESGGAVSPSDATPPVVHNK
jgi:O-glycosyl hydrolase